MSGRSGSCGGKAGFTLVEVMVVVGVVGLLASIGVPAFSKSRGYAFRNVCVNNLRQMSAAKEVAALSMNWAPDAGPATIGNPRFRNTCAAYIKGGTRPVCPTGVDCYFNALTQPPTCSSGLPGHQLD